ncbi:MAG: thioredoxin family protein [Phycisphaerae bacterium]|nr:thioredoxin family protein [Phycisphaerae bacterium]
MDTVGSRAKLVKVNIENAPHLAERFDVQTIPTLVVFKDADVIDRFVGM